MGNMAPDRGSPESSTAGQQTIMEGEADSNDRDSKSKVSAYYPVLKDPISDNEDSDGAQSARSSFSSEESLLQNTQSLSQASTKPDDQGEDEDGFQHFTVRSVLIGLIIGVLICFSNMYFGLQTGWISGMGMPAALIGFAFFKSISRCISLPFSPAENVLVQTVAGAVGTMPVGCGFVGVVPALEFLLKPEENGPLHLSTTRLVLWSLGICFFGVVFAIPLRKEVIIREKLKFPTGTATALMIGVLHGKSEEGKRSDGLDMYRSRSGSLDLLRSSELLRKQQDQDDNDARTLLSRREDDEDDHRDEWKANIKVLLLAFTPSLIYTIVNYFIPQLRHLPVFGLYVAREWVWTLRPSPAYVGQGIIMGPSTTTHILIGAVIGWGVLSPLAKHYGWAPGPVDDWTTGSKGWIVWVSLAIMLVDALISLSWLALKPMIAHGPLIISQIRQNVHDGSVHNLIKSISSSSNPNLNTSYTPLTTKESSTADVEPDAPSSQQIGSTLFFTFLVTSVVIFFIFIHFSFPSFPLLYAFLSLLFAIILSIMGVRAQGETDINPVSGISKLTQLVFALITSASNPNHIIINLLAGAISESGALQAGDMMQDLKTGHLLGASPRAQFYGQMIGSGVGAIVTALVYKLYISVYPIPGKLFQTPTAYVWIFTARLVTGKGLPPMAAQFAVGFGIVFGLFTCIRIWAREKGKPWGEWIPGGIAVAVGMYNVPSFTLARFIGGMIAGWWVRKGRDETKVVVLASGLILGEGLGSVVHLGLQSAHVKKLEGGWR